MLKPSVDKLIRYVEWSHSRDAGTSSKTLLSCATGIDFNGGGYPSEPRDPDDFGRCQRLLTRFPELRPGLRVAANKYPGWAALVPAWEELEELYDAALVGGGKKRWYALYNRMRELRGEQPVQSDEA